MPRERCSMSRARRPPFSTAARRRPSTWLESAQSPHCSALVVATVRYSVEEKPAVTCDNTQKPWSGNHRYLLCKQKAVGSSPTVSTTAKCWSEALQPPGTPYGRAATSPYRVPICHSQRDLVTVLPTAVAHRRHRAGARRTSGRPVSGSSYQGGGMTGDAVPDAPDSPAPTPTPAPRSARGWPRAFGLRLSTSLIPTERVEGGGTCSCGPCRRSRNAWPTRCG